MKALRTERGTGRAAGMPALTSSKHPCTGVPIKPPCAFPPVPPCPPAQHAVTGLVQLAGCLPEGERAGTLLSAFADLCADQVWSVRQDCASDLAALAQHLPREAVRDRLLPLWQALAGDISAWVQAAAKRQAGPLLAAVHPDDCMDGAAGLGGAACVRSAWPAAGCLERSWRLLQTAWLNDQRAHLAASPPPHPTPAAALLDCYAAAANGPAPLTEACAHFLPAVLRNLGPERWPRLK